MRATYPKSGFTLIEMSIVLVIIGLIVGGVLVGQSLISAAAMRAQISQIEKYNQAANTFFGKYGYLPGDIPSGPAAQFGFAARGTIADHLGEGDGDGLLEGNWSGVSTASPANGLAQGTGETVLVEIEAALSCACFARRSFQPGFVLEGAAQLRPVIGEGLLLPLDFAAVRPRRGDRGRGGCARCSAIVPSGFSGLRLAL
jgi:prepilin-type N-terminal cleavage/methylation domain-containing protein